MGGKSDSPMEARRTTLLSFGAARSLFLLAATKDTTIKIHEGVYVGGLITGADSKEDVLQLYREARQNMGRAGMKLRK